MPLELIEGRAQWMLFRSGAPNSAWTEIGRYAMLRKGQESQEVEILAPTEPGAYDVRLFKALDKADASMVAQASFTVRGTDAAGRISIDKDHYTAGEEIQVTVTGISEEMAQSQAQLVIFAADADHNRAATNWTHVTAGDSTKVMYAPDRNGEFEVRLYSRSQRRDDDAFVMAVPFTVSGGSREAREVSDWAAAEVTKAEELGLIPASLQEADLTKPITRAEFAAVSVKLYERLAETTAAPAPSNPFTDTRDPAVLKALNVGITDGVAADRFAPDERLNREQAATMLTRVFKASFVAGWTLAGDANFTLNYTQPATFADDEHIADWAKPSVYFMVAHSIIEGVGNNLFAPKAVTSAQQAAGYAIATREQALAIAVRLAENLTAADAN